MGRMFGTDGVRGVANRELTPELCMRIGKATAAVLGCGAQVLVGCDTRESADMIEAALVAGLCSMGADALIVGTVPTPAVAYLVTAYGADAGIMISASHNSYEYNGIKIFGAGGYKLTDEQEDRIEALVKGSEIDAALPPDGALGRRVVLDGATERYIAHICDTTDTELDGIRVLIDCANGSASVTAGSIFRRLKADCDLICDQPNGTNINDGCGSTHLERLAEGVVQGGYQLGIAFDGDADRMLAVDETGRTVNGDQLLAILGDDMKRHGRLHDDRIVVTVMSNLGFFAFAEQAGIRTCTTAVGDRYVLEQMRAHGYNLGGEQSGHIIFTDYMTTGDGELSAVQLLTVLKKSGQSLGQLAKKMRVFPQVLKNVPADAQTKERFRNDTAFQALLQDYEAKLNGKGRILVRPSGTEPLLRVMIEGEQLPVIERLAEELAQIMQERFRRSE